MGFMTKIDKLEKAAKAQAEAEFLELIEIDSPSWGEQAIAKVLLRKLKELGMETQQDETGNIYGYLPGNASLPPILLSAHMDTVEPSKGKKAIIEPDGTIRSAGAAVLGADCVAGLVEILQGIRLVQASGLPHRPVEIIFSVAEETYCEGLEKFDFSKVKSKDSYVLDLTGKSGTSHMAMMFLSNWLKQFSRVGQLPVTSEYIAENQVHLGKGGRLDDILTRGGAAVVRLWLDEWHYVMLSGIRDGMVYMFDPYFRDTPYEDYPQVQVVLHQPFAYNRIVPADMFNTTELSLYALGPVEEREAVLLGNQNTLLTAEKTIEYFI